jgi:hypothetical protein
MKRYKRKNELFRNLNKSQNYANISLKQIHFNIIFTKSILS